MCTCRARNWIVVDVFPFRWPHLWMGSALCRSFWSKIVINRTQLLHNSHRYRAIRLDQRQGIFDILGMIWILHVVLIQTPFCIDTGFRRHCIDVKLQIENPNPPNKQSSLSRGVYSKRLFFVTCTSNPHETTMQYPNSKGIKIDLDLDIVHVLSIC